MTEITSYRPGMPCWLDLGTTDTAAAREFYGRLFGWDYEVGGPETGGYIQALLRGKRVAGMYELMPEMLEQGVPPNWTTYLSIDDVDDTAKRIAHAGGTVVIGPMDIMDEGKMLVAQDPTGATFGGWQPQNHYGSQLRDEHGTPTWVEVLTRDPDRARDFYGSVFGYDFEDMGADFGGYILMNVGGENAAGLWTMPEQVPAEVPPHWMPYFAVDDADATVEAAQASGASVLNGPMDMETVGRFATLQDPLGAAFSIIKLAERSQPTG